MPPQLFLTREFKLEGTARHDAAVEKAVSQLSSFSKVGLKSSPTNTLLSLLGVRTPPYRFDNVRFLGYLE